MYRIIKTDGTELGVVDKPHYIRYSKSGCFVEADEREAIGVAYKSEPYNLLGHDEIEGAETVLVSELDGGEVAGIVGKNAANIDYLSMMSGIDLPDEDDEETAEEVTGDE